MTRGAIRARQVLIKRARRALERIKWPEGFDGGVLWCPHCVEEILRIPKGEERTRDEQQAAVDAHNAVCTAQRLKLVDA